MLTRLIEDLIKREGEGERKGREGTLEMGLR